jgi:predicted MPP superfamily phosphohydrolase
MDQLQKKQWLNRIWDVGCALSLIGIWPRFIEPHLLSVTSISFIFSDLPEDLIGLKILQFSDLHWSARFSSSFTQRLIQRIHELEPDLILFTGDFLCRSKMENPEGLLSLLNAIQAPYGCFAILGNHDYEQFVTVNSQGDYDVELSSTSELAKGFKRLWKPFLQPSGKVTEAACRINYHQDLLQLLRQTPFKLLNNQTQCIKIKNSFINICGLEEYTLGRANLNQAFDHYRREYPGIILVHHPDCIPQLDDYPGQIVLSGHTHGGQINLPGIWKKFACLENPHLKRGLIKRGSKWLYINRGIGSVIPFRWCSRPEFNLMTFYRDEE